MFRFAVFVALPLGDLRSIGIGDGEKVHWMLKFVQGHWAAVVVVVVVVVVVGNSCILIITLIIHEPFRFLAFGSSSLRGDGGNYVDTVQCTGSGTLPTQPVA